MEGKGVEWKNRGRGDEKGKGGQKGERGRQERENTKKACDVKRGGGGPGVHPQNCLRPHGPRKAE